jgi:hypothetical protein
MTEDIIPQGRLAELLEAGYSVTYAEDTVIGDGWFADLRDGLGRVTESGGGRTQAEARERLAERAEREPQAAAAADPGAPIMHNHLTALLDAGHEVTLDARDEKGRYGVHITRDADGESWFALEDTAAAAIWTASPLRADDEPMPKIADLIAETSEELTEALGEVRAALPTPGMRDDIRTLSAEMSDAFDRLDALEGHRGDMSALIFMLGDLFTRVYPDGYTAASGGQGIDSHVWYCAKCGGQCIGAEPVNHVCRGCGGH